MVGTYNTCNTLYRYSTSIYCFTTWVWLYLWSFVNILETWNLENEMIPWWFLQIVRYPVASLKTWLFMKNDMASLECTLNTNWFALKKSWNSNEENELDTTRNKEKEEYKWRRYTKKRRTPTKEKKSKTNHSNKDDDNLILLW